MNLKSVFVPFLPVVCMLLCLLGGCDEQETPGNESASCRIALRFDTALGEQDFLYTRASAASGTMRYTVHAYSLDEQGRVATTPAAERVYTQAVSAGSYNYNTPVLQLPVGQYLLAVWADFTTPGTTDDLYYRAADFSEITLTEGTHRGGDALRDAFRGSQTVTLSPENSSEADAAAVTIAMERPLARFTFVSTDLPQFVAQELAKLARAGQTKATEIDLGSYSAVVYYPGFMPSAYNLFTDKPVDARSGVSFPAALVPLENGEVEMGWDYVLVNGTDAGVEVAVGLLNAAGEQIARSQTFTVPLRRGVDTRIRGSFLVQDAGGGIGIDSGFEGEHNVIIEKRTLPNPPSREGDVEEERET